MRGLSTLITFSACTTSGQFWQESEKYGLEAQYSPSSARICSSELGGDLGRMAAGLQQREHERGELVAHRQRRRSGRATSVPARAIAKRRAALVVVAAGRR